MIGVKNSVEVFFCANISVFEIVLSVAKKTKIHLVNPHFSDTVHSLCAECSLKSNTVLNNEVASRQYLNPPHP